MSERLRSLQKQLEELTTKETAFARSITLGEDGKMTNEQRQTLTGHQEAISAVQLLAEAEQRSIDLEKSKVQTEVETRTAVDTKDFQLLTEKKILLAFARGLSLNAIGLDNNEIKVLQAARMRTYEAQSRGMTVGTNADGGFLTFDYFSKKLIDKLRDYAGVMQLCEIMTTSTGNDFYMPSVDDADQEAVLVSEATSPGEDKLAVGRTIVGSHKLSTKVFRVSNELLTDSIIEVEALLMEKMKQRFGKAINRYATVGTGVAQPLGYATTSASHALEFAVAVSGEVSYEELNRLVSAINKAYLTEGGGKFAMSQWTEQSLRTVMDGAGRPIWGLGDMSKGNPNTLFGYPIVTNNHMGALDTDTPAISFGAHSTAHVVRMVNTIDIKRSEQRYFETDEVGFVGFKRFDAKAKQPEAVAILKGLV